MILAARDPKEFDKDKDWPKYARWCEFAEACHGTAQIIGHRGDERRQNEVLLAALRRLLSQAE